MSKLYLFRILLTNRSRTDNYIKKNPLNTFQLTKSNQSNNPIIFRKNT